MKIILELLTIGSSK